MKSFVSKAILFISLISLNYSCSKNIDSALNPVSENSSTTLHKMYEIDPAKQAPNDTTGRWTFIYDNANRLILDSSSFATNSIVVSFEYNASDTFAYRTIRKDFTSASTNSASSETTYYKFVNGKYGSDSVIYDYGNVSPRGTSTTIFKYDAGTIIRNFQDTIPEWRYADQEFARIHLTKSNGNIIHQIDTTISITNGSNSGSQIFETSVTYLNNPNPFYKLRSSVGKEYFNNIGIGSSPYNSYAPRYLISHQTSSNTDLNYEYTFRPDGYPLTATLSTTNNGNIIKKLLLFVY